MFAKEWTSAISKESIEKACSYSENPEALEALFGNINLSPKALEIEYLSTGIRKYFDDDKELRQRIEVKISRNGQKITFPFGMSINDTKTIQLFNKPLIKETYQYHGRKYFTREVKEFHELKNKIFLDYREIQLSMLYLILCCVRSEFYIPPIFEDFCSEFGYDTNSRKAFSMWQESLKVSQKFQSIFTDEEIESFPS